MDRRVFLGGITGITGITGFAGLTGAAALAASSRGARAAGPNDPPFRISLAQWSLHRALRGKEMDHLDFAKVAKDRFGIDAIEYVNSFFKDRAVDFDYLAEMKRRAAEHGVTSLLIMIDGEGDLADEDDERRRQAVENHFRWIAAARFLGCHSIRVNARGGGSRDDQMQRAADSLRRLGRIGDAYGIDVIVENHGGNSSDGSWLAATLARAAHPRVGSLPDFGNFRLEGDRWYDRYQGVKELMPFARAVSAKSQDFDAEGEEVHTDYRRMLEIVTGAGYHGYVGIEYEGDALSESDGIAATKLLLERVRAALAGT